MAARRPLVLIAGRKKELPVGDTIAWELLSGVPVYWPTSSAAFAGLTSTVASRLTDLDAVFGQTAQLFSASSATGSPIATTGAGLYIPFNLAAAVELFIGTTAVGRAWFRAGSGSSWGNWCEILHDGNHGSAGDPHAQYQMKLPAGTAAQFLRGDGAYSNELESNGDQRLVMRAASDTLVPNYTGHRARGTLASPTAISASDTMMLFVAGGWNGSEYKISTRVRMRAEEAYSSTASGSGLLFEATPVGSNAAVVRMRIDGFGNILPGADNTQNAGAASARFKEFFSGTSPINTSDARFKTPVRAMTDQEIAAAIALGAELGVYQWLEAIDVKGESDARLHPGMTVQRAIEVMESNGLDPMRYSFICYDEWPELPEILNCWCFQPRVVDDFGDLVREQVDAGVEVVQEFRAAGDLYSFRMSPLLAFIAAGERAARLTALANIEARLAAAEQALGLGA